ncbi:peptidoglycan/LPS O-acetylase OafA/YrhL [Azospirillum agricola]|uniref:acyltransferase family protein n=1 Tax=Azospirillum agricola TaxID=1720247 RepID=UPI001AE26429|nr:acyltransferase [Azospirillum agricola]MBP2227117.1 peptidoglycan/LPS O-acetylase OafA/YrhL [Azospirillum agricola]
MSGAGPAMARLAPLDALRGLAIAMVVLSHVAGPHLVSIGIDLGNNGLGTAGVLLFFLLSGYLIQGNLERQPLPVFLSRRLFKILPAYWLNIAAILALDTLGVGPETGEGGFPAISYVASAFMVTDLLGVEAVSGVFWTLLIEVRFYVFIALYHRLLGGRGLPLVVLGLIALNGLSWGLRGHGSALIVFFPAFYVGVAIHRAERAGWTGRSMALVAGVIAALTASLTLFADPHFAGSGLLLILDTALFIGALRLGLRGRFLEFLGRTSYSTYLFHPVVGMVLHHLFGRSEDVVADLPWMAVALVLSVALGALLHRLVEEPMVRLGKGLEGWGRRSPVAVAPQEGAG